MLIISIILQGPWISHGAPSCRTHPCTLSAITSPLNVSFVEGALNHADFAHNICNSQAHIHGYVAKPSHMETHYNPPCGVIKMTIWGDLHMARINIHESTEPSIQNTVYPLNRRPLGERQHIGILRTAITILISSSNWFVFISGAWSDGDYRPKTCWPVAPKQVFVWRGRICAFCDVTTWRRLNSWILISLLWCCRCFTLIWH